MAVGSSVFISAMRGCHAVSNDDVTHLIRRVNLREYRSFQQRWQSQQQEQFWERVHHVHVDQGVSRRRRTARPGRSDRFCASAKLPQPCDHAGHSVRTGGSTSIVGRAIADKISDVLGEKVVVDNRPGAGGTVGTKAVAEERSRWLHAAAGPHRHAGDRPSLYKNPGYDPRKDFAPIGMIGNAPNSLVVHPSFLAKTVAELIAYAKANPDKVNFGSAGAGTASHITGEYFARTAGIKLVHIPYKGTGPALTDLLGGHIPMAFAPIPASHPNVSAGKLRALAVTSITRSGLLPDVPTMIEAGLSDFDASLYYGLVARQQARRGRSSTSSTRRCATRWLPTR